VGVYSSAPNAWASGMGVYPSDPNARASDPGVNQADPNAQPVEDGVDTSDAVLPHAGSPPTGSSCPAERWTAQRDPRC
jgi:hypothetical protein